MNKDNYFQYKLNLIKFQTNKLKATIRHVFPNLIVKIAVFTMILSLFCFAGSVSLITTEKQNNNFTQQNTGPQQNVDFELNTGPTNTQMETIQYDTAQMCYIGDDRMVGMEMAVYTDAHFIAQSSVGLSWFNETASVEFEKISNDIKICVVALGINDLWKVEDYITTLNMYVKKYPDIIFVYSTVGPVDENQYDVITNSSIEEFNKSMISGLSERWQIIDQYTYLASNGFNSYDGMHYSNAVSAGIFTWMVELVSVQTINTTK